MELKLIKLAVERLHDEVQALIIRNKELEQEVQNLKLNTPQAPIEAKVDDELIDTKQVLKYLGICYNTLQSIINKGLIQPIRINQRRIRFSKRSLQRYIQQMQTKPI